MKKGVLIAIIVIVILIGGLRFSFAIPMGRNITYNLEIVINYSGPYTLELPFPLSSNDYIERIFSESTVEGNLTKRIKMTENGPSLELSGFGNSTMSSDVKIKGFFKKDLGFSNLSMAFGKKVFNESVELVSISHMIYSSASNLALKYIFQYDEVYLQGLFFQTHWGPIGEWNFQGNLTKGLDRYPFVGYDIER